MQENYVCFILLNEYDYSWEDWLHGKNYCVSLSDGIKHKELHNIIKIKNSNFEIKLSKLDL